MITEEHKQKYWDIFVNRADVYSVQMLNGSYMSVKQQLIPEMILGDQTIGLYQLDKDSKIKWAVVDFDVNKEKAKIDPNFDFQDWDCKLRDQVKCAVEIFDKAGVPNYIEFSGFRGYHVWMFFNEPVDAGVVRGWMHELFSGMTKVDLDLEWELFPKQDSITGGGFGNLVKAPLHIHLKSNKRTYFVDKEFNKVEGLPEIEFFDAKRINIFNKLTNPNPKKAPKAIANKTQTDKVQVSNNRALFPEADNIEKMIGKCQQVKNIIKRAIDNNHLEHEERVIIANLGRSFGKDGLE